mmetsp:Transcript_14879/g.18405  ORF Transcript_14879/g.18405 Transcript_14879/m.18405 type:complete len:628 (-) Transcript_14879:1164-3047(-)|eukprot:CAMPEP_0204838600 /NCGR_PEP_ID=MMETSP1346-20131115/31331_1 /ASSEMBLY_ACC=CAM_ASM_000771 /TAXON_ID=215587 /ORGANISM="Aplanochytrium stocchinoi, Strain GSBS06" /LENGTH=627 /DNA_ID=CAMNT_0051974751 /DNA_START=289 /DNA_END=2172 /DNA_ORIENTATION=+
MTSNRSASRPVQVPTSGFRFNPYTSLWLGVGVGGFNILNLSLTRRTNQVKKVLTSNFNNFKTWRLIKKPVAGTQQPRIDFHSFPNKIENSYLEGGMTHNAYFLFALTCFSVRDAFFAYYDGKLRLKSSLYEKATRELDRVSIDIYKEGEKRKRNFAAHVNKTYEECSELYDDLRVYYADCYQDERRKRKFAAHTLVNKTYEECNEVYGDLRVFYADCCTGLSPAISRFNSLMENGRMNKIKDGMKLLELYHTIMHMHGEESIKKLKCSNEELKGAKKYLADTFALSNAYTKVNIKERELYNLDRMVLFSALTYGWKSLYFLGLCRLGNIRRMCSNLKAISSLTNVGRDDILVFEDKSQIFLPGHFALIDHENKRVVVSIRGTSRFQDIITNLTCSNIHFDLDVPVENNINDNKSNTIKGRTHEGFAKSAIMLSETLSDLVIKAIDDNPGYAVETTGHSMGGAVACLLALRWAQDKRFLHRNVKVHAYTFGSPGILCENLSQSQFVQNHVTSVVLGEDFVTRLSLGSYDKFVRTCEQLAEIEPCSSVETKSGKEEELLFPGGRVIRIPYATPQCDKNDKVLITQEIKNCSLSDILLTKKMFKAHLPSQYMNGVRMQIHLKNNHFFHLV